ncbi:MAG: RsmE family RNA methyltransferase [Spirochaetia bacterium]|nr:RsmE family RNA methyltransferase [Spirochaetia bacterium]
MNIILFEDANIPKKISIKDERAKHILKILKLRPGEEFTCGLVNGPSGKGSITSIDLEWIHFSWIKTVDYVPLYPLTLLMGYTRPISSKRILREAASLGVERIIFTGTDTGEKSYRDSNLWKGEYRGFLMDGAQQAASTGLPNVEFYRDLQTFLRENFSGQRIVLDNIEPEIKLSQFNPGEHNSLLAIGSERGWSDRERNIFRREGFVFASLGCRTLRTETASTAGITLLLARMGLI